MSTATLNAEAPRYGVPPAETLKSMSGLAFLSAIRDGALPQPPICQALDFALVEVEEGRAVFRGRPSEALYNPIGSVHGGWPATLLDSCMACAVHSGLPQGVGYTTLEFKINLVRAITEASGPVEAEGTVIQSGRRIGVAEGRLRDGAGKLLASGTTTCLIFPL
ncbi:MAG: PaaI family thioesterase [Kiloniellales bacterium]|nr:PaaI family thioesterase [Kiloniellales bacterium]